MYTDKLCVLERTLVELRKDKEEILNKLNKMQEIDKAISNIEEEIQEVKEKMAYKTIFNSITPSEKPANEFLTNGCFSCKVGDDIEDYNVVEFRQDYDNVLVVKVVDFYSYQKNQSLLGILEKIKSDGKFITVSLDNLSPTGVLINNITYQECKVCGYRFFKSYHPEDVENQTIFEIKIKYNKSTYSSYIEEPSNE